MTKEERAQFAQAISVSRETMERFEVYASLLERWNPKINLVSRKTLDHLWTRHFLDSAQIFKLSPETPHWADLGSGGGFPGAVLAIMACEYSPGMKVTLVESDQRKAAFLRTISRETEANFSVVAARIERADALQASTVSARALAPLPKLLALAVRHLGSGGTAIFPKGETVETEIKQALESWTFRCEKHTSIVDADATILVLRDIDRV